MNTLSIKQKFYIYSFIFMVFSSFLNIRYAYADLIKDDKGGPGGVVTGSPSYQKPKEGEVGFGFDKLNGVITPFLTFMLGVTVLTVILAFLYLFIKLASNGDNPSVRNEIFREMLVLAVIAAMLGGFSFFYFFFYGLFK